MSQSRIVHSPKMHLAYVSAAALGVDMGHVLAAAILYGFLRSYNQRRQAGQGLRELQEIMLQ